MQRRSAVFAVVAVLFAGCTCTNFDVYRPGGRSDRRSVETQGG